jgi:hypothetical protein
MTTWAEEFEGGRELTAPDNEVVVVRVDERQGYAPENLMAISCAALRNLLHMPNEQRIDILRGAVGDALRALFRAD